MSPPVLLGSILRGYSVGSELNTIGSAMDYVSNQIKFNSNKMDSLNTGLGSLVPERDLARL